MVPTLAVICLLRHARTRCTLGKTEVGLRAGDLSMSAWKLRLALIAVTAAVLVAGAAGCSQTAKHVSGASPGAVITALGGTPFGVSATSGTSAWAVGSYSTATGSRTLILRWNGTSWSKAASPNPVPGYDILFGVSATCGSNAWAVGYYLTASGSSRTLVLHWNGTSWSRT